MNELITKDIKILILALVIIIGYGFVRLVPPKFTELAEKQTQIKEVSTQIIDLEKKKSELSAPKVEETIKPNIPIEIYKSLYVGKDIESTGMELVYQLLKIVGNTGNKVTEISMTPSGPPAAPSGTPADASQPPANPSAAPVNMGESASSQPAPEATSASSSSYGVLNVTMKIDCSYVAMQNLLQKIATWNYLSEIKFLIITPKPNNNNALEALLSVDLYVGQ